MHSFSGPEFESEVRKIARNLFSNSLGQGAEHVDGRERDGVFWNGDFFTIIEATIDRRKAKAETDAEKTHALVTKKRSEGYMARGFIVTLHDPTADQRLAVKKYEKTTKIISFDELRSLLFDSSSYLRVRTGKPFGSIYDHVKYTYDVPRSEFVEPTILSADKKDQICVRDFVDLLEKGGRFVVTAEYGVGKSMLLREIFHSFIDSYRKKETFRTPLAINLREHIGQDDPIELLERHARANGADPRRLVAAWSAGYLDLLIDGFDELSTRGWTGDHRKLREFRRSTHRVLRNLISQTPSNAAIIVAGRTAYFDSEPEMRESIGIHEGIFKHYVIHHFDEDQANEYLRKRGIKYSIPSWVPARPLFLSYLISKNLLQETVTVKPQGSFPEGSAWSSLLQMIAEREAAQSEGVDKKAILDFLGLMATRARQSTSLQKSFTPSEMDEIFNISSGNSVSEDERRLLMRLPGLGIAPDSQNSRIFIDSDFLNASSAYLLSKHIESPYADENKSVELRAAVQQLSPIGIQLLCSRFEEDDLPVGLVEACARAEMNLDNHAMSYDILSSLMFLAKPKGSYLFSGLEIQEIDLCADYFDNVIINFDNCIIDSLILPSGEDFSDKTKFTYCLIGNIDGRPSENDLPSKSFINCEIGNFSSSYSVNDEILDSSLPLGVRVLVVTLRKVFVQAGQSRLESALLRGLDHRAKMVAPEVISALVRRKYLTSCGRKGKTIYAGSRDKRKEALEIIRSPSTYKCEIIEDCRKLA